MRGALVDGEHERGLELEEVAERLGEEGRQLLPPGSGRHPHVRRAHIPDKLARLRHLQQHKNEDVAQERKAMKNRAGGGHRTTPRPLTLFSTILRKAAMTVWFSSIRTSSRWAANSWTAAVDISLIFIASAAVGKPGDERLRRTSTSSSSFNHHTIFPFSGPCISISHSMYLTHSQRMTSACVMMASTFFSGSRSVTHKVEPTTVIVAARAERGTFGVDDRDAVNVGLGEGSEELSQRSGAIERQPRVTSLPPHISRRNTTHLGGYVQQWSPVAVPRDR